MPDNQRTVDDVITKVALRHADGHLFILPSPERHHDVIYLMSCLGYDAGFIGQCEQGFVTDRGTFVGREEAWKVAAQAGQFIRDPHVPGTLFSEDVW